MSNEERKRRLRACYALLTRLANEKQAASRESLDSDTRPAASEGQPVKASSK